ncbi:hypothetical protein J0H58_21860 [bacterium]|nr:hypothetical protein [bacterium]
MRTFLLAAVTTALAATAVSAGDAPPFFRGAYVMPTNRPVYNMRPIRVYVNGQAVERAVPAGYAAVYPRYVDRPGPILNAPVGRVSSMPVYPVITSTWRSPGQ